MKRLLFTLMTLVGTLAAQADDYPFLTFETQDGSVQSVSTTSLTLTFSNGNLVVNDGACSFALTDLKKMYFTTDDATDISQLNTQLAADGAVDVFTPGGVSLGHFDSLKAAQGALAEGLYVFKMNGGRTIKVNIR